MIYADNAATPRISEAAMNEMIRVMKENYGNPSSLYTYGQKAKEIQENLENVLMLILKVILLKVF